MPRSTVTGLSAVSFGAALSLQTIDNWIGNINQRMRQTNQAGFKADRFTFKGSLTNIYEAPGTNGRTGMMFGEYFLNEGLASRDFSQGQIQFSSSPTHIAINGPGLFLLTDDSDAFTRLSYYTRNGEFNVDAHGYLKAGNGLYVTNPDFQLGALGPPVTAFGGVTPPWAPTMANWEHRERLKIQNDNDTFSIPNQSVIEFQFDTKVMVAEGDLIRSDLEDLRVLRFNPGTGVWTELDRFVQNPNTEFSTVKFRTTATINPNSASEEYYIYYGNETAPAAPVDTTIWDGTGTPLPFLDDFEGPFPGVWGGPFGTGAGTWDMANPGGGSVAAGDTDQEMIQDTNTLTETRMTAGNSNWNDYRFSVQTGNLDNDNDFVYLYGRWDEATDSGYRFQLIGNTDPEEMRIERIVGGASTVLFSAPWTPDPLCTPGPGACPFWSFPVDMEFSGGFIRVFQNGNLIQEVDDSAFMTANPAFFQGGIALGNSSQSAWYDNVSVQPLGSNRAVNLGRDGLLRYDSLQPLSSQIGQLATFPDYRQLRLSPLGNTIFEQSANSGAPTFMVPGAAGVGELFDQSLEDSNATVDTLVSELALAKNLFESLTRILMVFDSNLEAGFSLIK